MREILFRGQRVDTKEWVEGDLLHLPHGLAILANGYANVDPETVGQFTGLYDSTKWEELTEEERDMFVRKGGMPSEWKGRKIFEGDILKITWVVQKREPVSHVCSVIYSKSGFFTNKDGRLKGQLSNYICGSGVMSAEGIFVEVIGNIHDNPELLEGGAE